MILQAYRIVKTKRSEHAFDGEGARLYGGRWNSPGTTMVYASSSPSLAQLEILVHIDKSMLLNAFSMVEVEFNESLVKQIDMSLLSNNWRKYPAPSDLQAIGDTWVKQDESAVLEMPSVVESSQSNYLINPQHADFKFLEIKTLHQIQLDSRLK